LRDALLLVLLVAVAYMFVNVATTRAMINGYSMQPELLDGDVVLVNRIAYLISEPQRGDVVVIRPPTTLCANPTARSSRCQPLIKRVIGLPGEDVQLIAGYVYVDGSRLDEPYIIPENLCGRSCDATFTLGDEEYLVLGDNRLRSYDGHYFGPIKGETIIGQAWLRYWPLERLQFIDHPRYDTLTAAAKERQ
jgi:signal peptidase I